MLLITWDAINHVGLSCCDFWGVWLEIIPRELFSRANVEPVSVCQVMSPELVPVWWWAAEWGWWQGWWHREGDLQWAGRCFGCGCVTLAQVSPHPDLQGCPGSPRAVLTLQWLHTVHKQWSCLLCGCIAHGQWFSCASCRPCLTRFSQECWGTPCSFLTRCCVLTLSL